MRALLLVDIQNDFLPGGALAVPEGDLVVPIANRLMPKFELVVATQDWHPPEHGSFAANHPGRRVGEVIDLHGLEQVLWPVHCVQETPGADLAPDLDRSHISEVVRKGTDPAIDSYSGFYDNGHRKATGLANLLKGRKVTDLYILGLATDYCVKFTALDARRLNFNTFLVEEACRGVNLQPDHSARAIEELRRAGVEVVRVEQVLAQVERA